MILSSDEIVPDLDKVGPDLILLLPPLLDILRSRRRGSSRAPV
jgi:hypothetical protein